MDGGTTWSLKYNWTVDDFFPDLIIHGALHGGMFIDDEFGWAVGRDGTFLRTADGGDNWEALKITTGDLHSVTFISKDVGWVGGSGGTILHTVDGGISWTNQSPSINKSITILSFVDEVNGWATGPGTTILRTEDGGGNWREIDPGVAPWSITDLHFANSEQGWLSGGRSVLGTLDGGTTWTLQFSSNSRLMYSVFFLDQNIGWASGDALLNTTTGGF